MKNKILYRALYIFFYAFAILPDASAGLILPGNDPFHLNEGQNPNFDAVGFVFQYDGLGNMVHRESMNLVHTNFSATAIHGIEGLIGDIYFGFGSYSAPIEVRRVSEIFRHPTSDFALLFTENPVVNIAPAKVFDGTLQNGDRIALAGYGERVYVGADPSTSFFDGNKRAGAADIISNLGFFAPDQFTTSVNRTISPFYTPGEMGGWFGHSGGGGYTTNFELAAIADSVNLNTNYGAITNFTLYPKTWSDTTIANKMTAVPEPGTMALCFIGVPLVAFFRKNKEL